MKVIKSPIFLKRVVLKNYKSIAECSVNLDSLNFLVGPNGSGKSNFLDALRFVTESLDSSLDHALREGGGISEVRRRSKGGARPGRPTHFGIRLEFNLPDGMSGHYSFRVGAISKGGFEVQQEECYIWAEQDTFSKHFYVSKSGVVLNTSVVRLTLLYIWQSSPRCFRLMHSR